MVLIVSLVMVLALCLIVALTWILDFNESALDRASNAADILYSSSVFGFGSVKVKAKLARKSDFRMIPALVLFVPVLFARIAQVVKLQRCQHSVFVVVGFF